MDQTKLAFIIRSAMLVAIASCTPEPGAVVSAPIEIPTASPAASAKVHPAAPAVPDNALATAAPTASVKRPRTARQPAPKDCCKGKNDCKGQSGCATASNACSGMAHACAGQNACKGSGTSCPPKNP